MDEIKEIFESLRARIKSPYFGYLFFFTLFLNWKAWFYLFFADIDVKSRYFFFDTETTTASLIFLPLSLAFLAVIVSPWLRLLFMIIAKYPTTQRNILQAQAENEILEEKNRLKKMLSESQAIDEKNIISQAQRDEEVRAIEDRESRESVQKQIEKLRDAIEKRQVSPNQQSVNISASLRQNTANKGYRFYVKNNGSATANNVNFTLSLDNSKSPFANDYKNVFPVKELHPGDEVSIIAAISMEVSPPFDCVLSWTDPNGLEAKKVFTLTF